MSVTFDGEAFFLSVENPIFIISIHMSFVVIFTTGRLEDERARLDS